MTQQLRMSKKVRILAGRGLAGSSSENTEAGSDVLGQELAG